MGHHPVGERTSVLTNVKLSSLKPRIPRIYSWGVCQHVDENYFNVWSHNMAYILGLWFADGCICGNQLTISLHKRDNALLEGILVEMKSTHRIHDCGSCSILCICRKRIVDSIIRRGGIPNKSLKAKFPYVPKTYLPDFIRGLWDGDGSIFYGKKDKAYHSSFCSGSKEFIDSMFEILKGNIPDFNGHLYIRCVPKGYKIINTELKKDSKYYLIALGINDTRRLGEFMYNGSYLSMQRKEKLFSKVGKINIAYKDRTYWDYEKAKLYAQKLKLKNRNSWKQFYKDGKIDNNIPSAPNSYYKQWDGWQKFLGYSHAFVSLEEAKEIIKKENIKCLKEWKFYRKNKNDKLPFHPNKVYKEEGWNGWCDYFSA